MSDGSLQAASAFFPDRKSGTTAVGPVSYTAYLTVAPCLRDEIGSPQASITMSMHDTRMDAVLLSVMHRARTAHFTVQARPFLSHGCQVACALKQIVVLTYVLSAASRGSTQPSVLR